MNERWRPKLTDLDQIMAVAIEQPGSTAVQIRDMLRIAGLVSLTSADVTTTLRLRPSLFRPDNADPPRWWPTSIEIETIGAPSGVALYAWQSDALRAWQLNGSRGVVEAVTGTGKTMLGIAAARDELSKGGQVCVVVPTRDLAEQWTRTLHNRLPAHFIVGRLGDGGHDHLGAGDILVAVVNSARLGDLRPRRPGGLLIADECHRYGSPNNRVVLSESFQRRLGLSATYARPDDGHRTWLDPYFGGVCFEMGYTRAIADGVAARFDARLVGVEFDHDERADYEEFSELMAQSLGKLRSLGVNLGAGFLDVISALVRRGGDDNRTGAARAYLGAMQQRRHLLAETPAKLVALQMMIPTIESAARALVFTQSIQASEAAANVVRHGGLSAEAVHSGLAMARRRELLDRFRCGEIKVLVAPQILDEGIDVPDADLAIVLAASQSRRQMIQRMGRVLRPKPDGRRATFLVVFVADTVEDPGRGAHETFLTEITAVADSVEAGL